MSFRIDSIPEVVRNKAATSGANRWLAELPEFVAEIERDWGLAVGRVYQGGTEALVADADLNEGGVAVLKLCIPRPGFDARHEIEVLRLTRGDGCAELLRADEARGALLLERLGPSLFDLRLPLAERHEALCAAAERMWRPAPDCGFQTGAEKGRWLVDFIVRLWDELDRPCTERSVDDAVRCAESRIRAHDDERAVLVHGDLHQWNALQVEGGGFKLIDPDGLLAEAEYDMGIVMREDPEHQHETDLRRRARWLADRTGLDGDAIWEWGVAERVSTGLLATQIGLGTVGRDMLALADEISASSDVASGRTP